MKIREIIGVHEPLFEMSNLSRALTGVGPFLYCGPKAGAQHDCRVKVSNVPDRMDESDCFSIAISDYSIVGESKISSSQMEDVRWWIYWNKRLIVALWFGKIGFEVFIRHVKDVTNQPRNFVPPWKK